MTREQLIGYVRHPAPSIEPLAKCLWQKRIENKEGRVLYFINILEYPTIRGCFPFSPEVRFYLQACVGGGFDVHLHDAKTMTVPQIEALFQDIYESLGCVPDPHND